MTRTKRNRQQSAALHAQIQPGAITAPVQPDGLQPAASLQAPWNTTAVHRPRPVDSWRSYREDTSNLQSLTKTRLSELNPTAADFEPTSDHSKGNSHYTSYEPLRSSNGQGEKQAVQQARRKQILQTAINSQASHNVLPPGRYGSYQTDQPLPSIEQVEQGTIVRPVTVPGLPHNSRPWTRTRGPRVNNHKGFNRRLSTQTPEPLPIPSPTTAYKLQANLEPMVLQQSQRLLVILDLNGTLLFRKNRANSPTSFKARPGVDRLLNYLFDNHTVMVYTSARPVNAVAMVGKLLSPKQRDLLAAIWARDKLDLTHEQYINKIQVYKKLGKVWNDTLIQTTAGERRCWDQSNTVLIDDSHLKAMAQPHNLLQVPEFINDVPKDSAALQTWTMMQEKILETLESKLEELKWTCDVSRLIRKWQAAEVLAPAVQQVENTQSTSHVLPVSDEETDDNHQLATPRSPSSNPDNPSCLEDVLEGKETDARSVSPIDESVWSDLLGNSSKEVEAPATPKSLGE